jgi:hypothetical protein
MKVINDGKTLVADEGKVLMCKCHNIIMGSEVYLKEIMQDGVLKIDSVDNYIEIDEPEMSENNENVNE